MFVFNEALVKFYDNKKILSEPWMFSLESILPLCWFLSSLEHIPWQLKKINSMFFSELFLAKIHPVQKKYAQGCLSLGSPTIP